MLLLLIDKIGQSKASSTICRVMRFPQGKQKAIKAFQKCVGLRFSDQVSSSVLHETNRNELDYFRPRRPSQRISEWLILWQVYNKTDRRISRLAICKLRWYTSSDHSWLKWNNMLSDFLMHYPLLLLFYRCCKIHDRCYDSVMYTKYFHPFYVYTMIYKYQGCRQCGMY